MPRFSLHTVGADQVGIVAAVTAALSELGANVEETNMTILHGQSAIMLVLEVPNVNDGRLIEGVLEAVAEKFNLFVTVRPLPEEPPAVVAGETYLVSVSGARHPNLVANVTTAIAGIGANVDDLVSRPIEIDGAMTYALRMTVILPGEISRAALEGAIRAAAASLGASYELKPWSGDIMWDV